MSDIEATLSQDQISRLGRGEILIVSNPEPGSQLPRVTIMAVIETPPARVWALIDDADNYENTLAGVKSSQELSRDGENVRVRATIGTPFPLKDITSVSACVHRDLGGGRYRRTWRMEQGDYKTNSGSWDLCPFSSNEARTLVVYQVHVAPKMRIPKKVLQMAQTKAGPKMIEKIRRLCR